MCNDLGLTPILVAGSPDQKRDWLRPCAERFSLVSFCLSEPNAGSDVAGLQLLAEKDGSDYRLRGTKCWITNGGEADLFTVFATLDRRSRHNGICAFIAPVDTPGISRGKKEDKMGQRASDTRVLDFDGVRVPAAQRLGAEGEGFKIAMLTLDRTRPPIAALATGIAQRALDEATKYAAERKAFGAAISGFQAVQFMLADMAKDIEAARLLTLQSAWMVDGGAARVKILFDGEVLRYGCRDAHHHRCRPGLRRQRLHARLPGREADARRQADADLRGYQPDPAPGDRP